MVKIHFICKLDDGAIIESSVGREPLEFTIGEGQVNSSLEYSVMGMIPGESKSIEVPAVKAFGPHIKEVVYTVKRESFPDNLVIQVGLPIKFPRNDRQISEGVVIDISESSLTIDANHPLAGKDLFFDIHLLEITKHGSRNADKYNSLGIDLHNNGKLDEAIICYQEAIKLNPKLAAAYNNLGCVYEIKGQFDDAIICYTKALQINQINPNASDTYYNLGNALKEQGNLSEALKAYNNAFVCNNSNIKARWAHCMSQIPIIYSDQSSIELYRGKYSEELTDLIESIPLKSPENIENAAIAVGSHTPFYLAYQGLNDRELQKIYGELVCRIMALKYPQFAALPSMPSWLPGAPLRIGIASGYFCSHSNWKIPIKGWVENLDKKRFCLHGYYTGKIKDKETAVARQYFSRFVEDIYSLDKLCEFIRNDNLHILIYPEIGMDPVTTRLASLRLSPIQCTSWGHPDTSGLPTIDYFLSSDLMEPADADDHYTEKLIRLPNLSIYYTPVDFPPADINRETFNLRQKSVLYLCCQSLYKYIPQYDEVYPRIAKEVGDCQFLFIAHESNYVTEQFRQRIYQSFEKFGLRADNYIVFLPRLDVGHYGAINSLSDIYLDSISWSGCNSTFEAISYNLPIVTLPGELMRGRHTSAILTMMGITETIAATKDEYIELAVRLGLDSEWRKYISDKIASCKHVIYYDKTCIKALEDFLGSNRKIPK